MSNLIKKMAIILLSAIIFGALFYFIFFKSYTSEDTEGQGIFGTIGQNAEDLTISSGDKPDVSFDTELSYTYKFNGHRIYNDSITDIRDLFTIQEENSTDFVDGSLATTFFINILDVKNKDGQSVLTMVDDFNNSFLYITIIFVKRLFARNSKKPFLHLFTATLYFKFQTY